ncbi:uncharacterized protein LOC131881643 [Tigriopus californicus]|uniref:uncharacterized protein LOC131881643 n=1 Tax=Tigriopus californicus TaxID=6832 RepID=UPI0027D9F5A3|nr:uncharacterized protein LOC131881643 [Tigriopus californicus]
MRSPTIVMVLLSLVQWNQSTLGQDAPPIGSCGLETRNLRTLEKIESIIEAKLELIRELINKARRDVTQMKAKAYDEGQIYNLLFLGAWVIEIVGDWVTNKRTYDNFNGQEDMVLSNYGMIFTYGVAEQASVIFGGLPNPADTRNCFFIEDFMTIANAFQGLNLRTCQKSFYDRASDFEFILKAKMSCILDSLEDSSAELGWILDEFLTGVSLRNQILDESEQSEEGSEKSEIGSEDYSQRYKQPEVR